MSDCRFGVSPVNYADPDPDEMLSETDKINEVHSRIQDATGGHDDLNMVKK